MLKVEKEKKEVKVSISARVGEDTRDLISVVKDAMNLEIESLGSQQNVTFTDVLEHIVGLIHQDDQTILETDEGKYTCKELVTKYFSKIIENANSVFERKDALVKKLNEIFANSLNEQMVLLNEQIQEDIDSFDEIKKELDEEDIEDVECDFPLANINIDFESLDEIKNDLVNACQYIKEICDREFLEFYDEAIESFKKEVFEYFKLGSCQKSYKYFPEAEKVEVIINRINRLIKVYLHKQENTGIRIANREAYNEELEKFLDGNYEIDIVNIYKQLI